MESVRVLFSKLNVARGDRNPLGLGESWGDPKILDLFCLKKNRGEYFGRIMLLYLLPCMTLFPDKTV